MTIQDLDNKLNNAIKNDVTSFPQESIQITSNEFKYNNQLVTKEYVKNNYITDDYHIVFITKDCSGSLRSILKQKDIILKPNVEEALIDIFLIGGGSSGSCWNTIEGCPVTGETFYKRNISINVNNTLNIQVGKGGEATEGGYTNDMNYIWLKKGGDTMFNDYVAKGGNKVLDENGNIIEFSGSYGKDLPYDINQEIYYIDKHGDKHYIRKKTLGLGHDVNLNMVRGNNFLNYKNNFIPYTNIFFGQQGIHYITKNKNEDYATISFSTSLISFLELLFPNSIYPYNLNNSNGNLLIFPWERYSGGDRYKYEIQIIDGSDNDSFGGSGNCCSIAPIKLYSNHEKFLEKYPNAKEFDYYRGRIGAGGSGVCVLYIRRDYCV